MAEDEEDMAPIDKALESVIDTDGDRPSVNWGEFAGTSIAFVVLGWIFGVVDLVQAIFAGIAGAILDLEGWISDEVIGDFFGVTSALNRAIRQNGEFIDSLGAFGPVMATIQIAAVVLILIWIFTTAGSIVKGVF